MIKFLMIFTKQGKLRISRFFEKTEKKQEIQQDVMKMCLRDGQEEGVIEYQDVIVVYRQFSNLILLLGITRDENELAALEVLQNLAETLHKYFNKASELEIVFNMDRVYMIIDEMIVNGNVAETNQSRILALLQVMDAAKK